MSDDEQNMFDQRAGVPGPDPGPKPVIELQGAGWPSGHRPAAQGRGGGGVLPHLVAQAAGGLAPKGSPNER